MGRDAEWTEESESEPEDSVPSAADDEPSSEPDSDAPSPSPSAMSEERRVGSVDDGFASLERGRLRWLCQSLLSCKWHRQAGTYRYCLFDLRWSWDQAGRRRWGAEGRDIKQACRVSYHPYRRL